MFRAIGSKRYQGRGVVQLLSALTLLFAVSGCMLVMGGCGSGSDQHPLAKEGISPYDKAKASMDSYKAEIMKRKQGNPARK